MARIAALLSPYYERDVPQAVREIEAEDWAAALADYPQWAVEAAVRWWKGADNPDRRRRPLEGDIAARCRQEFGPVLAARIIVERRLTDSRPAASRSDQRVSPEAAAEIMARAGFSARRVSE